MMKSLVVGASGTIGSAVVKLLNTQGWEVIRSSSRNQGDGADCYIDFTKPETIAPAADRLEGLDGVVICSGHEPQQSLKQLAADHLNLMIAIHVTGPILLLQALEAKMTNNSAVVFISSAAAFTGSYDPAYATAKGALVSLTRTMARAWSPRVRVNAIAPSLIDESPVFHRMTDDFRQRHRDISLLNRLATPEDCAESIMFLLSHKHLTGTILHMNGGQYFG